MFTTRGDKYSAAVKILVEKEDNEKLIFSLERSTMRGNLARCREVLTAIAAGLYTSDGPHVGTFWRLTFFYDYIFDY